MVRMLTTAIRQKNDGATQQAQQHPHDRVFDPHHGAAAGELSPVRIHDSRTRS